MISENDTVLIDFVHLIQSHIPPGVESNDQQVEFLIEINMKTLSQLHAKLLAASAQFEATAGEWERICDDVEHYRIILEGTPPIGTHMGHYKRWYWKWRFSGRADQTWKCLAVFASALSIIMFWCLITIPAPDSIMFVVGAQLLSTHRAVWIHSSSLSFHFSSCPCVRFCPCFSSIGASSKLTVRRTDASGLLFRLLFVSPTILRGFNYLLTLDWPISGD